MKLFLVLTLLACTYPAFAERGLFRRRCNVQYYAPSQSYPQQVCGTQSAVVSCNQCGSHQAQGQSVNYSSNVSYSGNYNYSGNVNYASSGGGDLISLINNYRAQNGLGPISHDPSLDISDNSGHGRFRRSRMSGVTNWASETDPQAVFNQWRNSPGHNANMLAPNITRGGFAPGIGGGTTFTAQ